MRKIRSDKGTRKKPPSEQRRWNVHGYLTHDEYRLFEWLAHRLSYGNRTQLIRRLIIEAAAGSEIGNSDLVQDLQRRWQQEQS